MCKVPLVFQITSLIYLKGLFFLLDELVFYPHHVRGLEEGQQLFSCSPVGIAGEESVLVRACYCLNFDTGINYRILLERAENGGGAELAVCEAWMGQQMGVLHNSRGSVLLVNYSPADASYFAPAFDISDRCFRGNYEFYRLCDFGVHKWDVRHGCMPKQPVF